MDHYATSKRCGFDNWMNDREHKSSLRVNSALNFTSCNPDVNFDSLLHGDGMYRTHHLLTDLVNSGIRLLVYSGNTDMMCNDIGVERWVNDLDTKFKEEFRQTKSPSWTLEDGGRVIGEVRSVEANNPTFVAVHEASHTAPYDKTSAASELITRWIANLPLLVQTNV